MAVIVVGIVVIAVMLPKPTKNTVENYDENQLGPIDLIVTWVCPDPVNDALRDYYSGKPSLTNSSRVKSREELLCLFRSIDMFAPWINHVYLVSVTGTPDWLDLTNSRVTVVEHKDFFEDPSVLPTFNSQSIESQLHKIPGLSERFIYCNDDMFFAAPVTPSDFFDSMGRAKVFRGRIVLNLGRKNDYIQAWINTKRLMKTRGIYASHHLKHQAIPLRKSTCFSAEREYREAFNKNASSRFRNNNLFFIHGIIAYYGLKQGDFVIGKISEEFVLWEKPSHHKKLRQIRKGNTKLLCVNNLDGTNDQIWQDFWRNFYYQKSSFER